MPRKPICFNCWAIAPSHKAGCYVLFLQNDFIVYIDGHEWKPLMKDIKHRGNWMPNVCDVKHCFYERDEHPVDSHEVLIFKYEP